MPRKRKRKKSDLTRAQKERLRASIPIDQAETEAHKREMLRASMAHARSLKSSAPKKANGSWADELALHPKWPAFQEQCKRERNYDPIGFLDYILSGQMQIQQRDSAGEGRGGMSAFVPRLWQMQILREIVEHRRTSRNRWLEIVVKGRQRGYSVLWDGFIWADCMVNPGIACEVTANQPKTLKALNQNFRNFAGRDKDEGKAERMADEIMETPGGSRVTLSNSNDSLGRGNSLTHVHISEADYIDDLQDALDSVLGSTVKNPWGSGVLESTVRRGSNSEFKDTIEETRKDQLRREANKDSGIAWMEDDWRVRFLSWMSDETAVVTLTGKESSEFMALIDSSDNRARDYERELRDKHRCTPGQIAWWHLMWRQDARRNLQRMIEMYPTTLDEALSLVASASYFDKSAIDFYRAMCRDPIERYKVGYDGLKVCEPTARGPMMELWHQPNPRYTYVIGADHADADTRVDERGSECYAIVLEVETGRQVAEYHGYVNTHEFAVALWRMAMWYNDAQIVPEVPVGGGGVVDALMNQLQYTNIFVRKKYGAIIEVMHGTYGFDTKGGSRKVITGRMQDNFNSKTLGIYSHYLLDQLVEFGKRGGRPQKKQQRAGQVPDDGCMALALCMEGHDNAVHGTWLPKDMESFDDNPRALVTDSQRAQDARKQLVVGMQPDNLLWLRERQNRERDVLESIYMDG